MWSEHCSYKHSKAVLRTFPTEGERVGLQGPGENAGIVVTSVTDSRFVLRLNRITTCRQWSPTKGPRTGLGGIIRDIFAMGARPIAAPNSLRFGPLEDARVRHSARRLSLGLPVTVIRSASRPSGVKSTLIPVIAAIRWLMRFASVCLEKDKIKLGKKASGVGELVLLVGARTGRDGIHGAAFASEELGDDAEQKVPTIQVGDPFMEKTTARKPVWN